MKPARAEATQVVDAPPAKVYGILADYRTHHPRILPKPAFESLVVEKGGVGAGTVVRVGMKVMGKRQTIVMEVSEPQPGRVLQERDVATGALTTFTVEPLDGGARSRVTLATEWPPRPGLAGWMERVGTPPVARRLYRQELQLLSEYARKAP